MSQLSETEYKHYRRLICCKIKKSDEKAFLKVIFRNGWKKTRLGKRGAKYSILKNLPNQTRYHLRLFEVQDYFLVSVHHEPSLKGDVVFHLKGFVNAFTSKESDYSEDKLELANYQQGIAYFKKKIESDAALRAICDFKIEETELKVFTVKFGFISLKTPVEIYIEDLKESTLSENKKDFLTNIRNIFQVIGFELIESNPEFLVFETDRVKDFTLLIQPINLSQLDLTRLGKYMKNFRATATVLICSKEDNVTKELSQKLAHLGISILPPKVFLKIFNIYRHSPISQEQLQQLFKPGLVDLQFIDEQLQDQFFSNIFNKTMELFQYLKDQTEWVYFDSLEYEFTNERNYTKEELNLILDFLTYPLINLVLTKTENRRLRRNKKLYRAITNFDEIQFRLKNIQMFLDKLS
ncbi:MAG: hypothetical protein HWN65_15685 [Candidatus Helarchaeota archaeon]|nr:hypothetical protein [Candidatus Helarchaeota archaeon]